MRTRVVVIATLVVLAYGCATTAPPPGTGPQSLHGVASWYGEEFAGRTTANGEIFDPSSLTAAHRTLPFGTILEVMNTKTHQSVWVRVNDRGPYIANRVIDLSYAAAQKIGLIEVGVGDVDIKVVKLGDGEREAPAAFDVTIAEAPKVAPEKTAAVAPKPVQSEAPAVEFPLPVKQEPVVVEEPIVVDHISVETQQGDIVTRKQVAPNGKTIEEVPTGERRPAPAPVSPAAKRLAEPHTKQFVVQVGAFAVEANATLLLEKLKSIGQRAWVDRDDLYRVRIGPFATRELAVEARTSLEASGLSAIIVAE